MMHRSFFTRFLAFLLTSLLLFAVSCSPIAPNESSSLPSQEGENSSSLEQEVSSEEISQAPKGNLNLLTGKYDLPDSAVDKRPVSFMINNIKVALPQYGIGSAEIIYEVLAEGGITRLMAVFSDYENLPSQIGPVRSTRDYYLDLAAPMDTIFVNWGTSNIAADTIRNRKLDNIDGMYYSNYFYTDLDIAYAKGFEHSRFMKPEGLKKAMDRKNQRTQSESDRTAFRFREENDLFLPDAQSVGYLRVKYSYSYDAAFTYDPETKTYLVSQFGDPHMDAASGKQLAFDNVIVIYTTVERIGTNDGKVMVDLTSGDGIYVSQGGGMAINWSKGDYRNRFTFTDASGKEVALNAGTTYVCIVPLTQRNNTEIKPLEEENSSVAIQG